MPGSYSFRLYMAVNFFSLNGIWINRILIGWLTWELTHSAAWVGALSSLQFAPTLLAGPFFGVIADRIDIKRGAFVTHLVMIALMLALWAAHALEMLDITVLTAIALLFGATASANHPIRLTMVPLLVPVEAITRAVTLISINFNAARLIGPAAGGLMIERLGAGTTMLASIALALPVLVAIPWLRPRPNGRSATIRTGFMAELADGARRAMHSIHIRHALIVTAITAAVARGALEVLPAIAEGTYGRGAAGLGQMLSAAGAGALMSGVVIALFGHRSSHLELLARSTGWMLLGILAVIVLGFSDNWMLALACVMALGVSGTFTSVYTQSAIQLETADAYRGRIVSLWLFVGMGTNAIGAIAFGLVADWLSMRVSLVAIGCLGLTLALASHAAARRRP